MMFWAGNFIVIKSALDTMPPVGFTFLRFALASGILLLLLRWREGSLGLPRRDAGPILLLGVIGFGVYQMLWTTGLDGISAGDSAVLIAMTPVLTALVAVAAGADTLTPGKLAGSVLSFAGVAVVIGGAHGLDFSGPLLSYGLTLLAAACWAIYTSFAAPFLVRTSPLRTTAWATTAGTLFLAPFAAIQLSGVDPATIGPSVGLGVLYSGLLAAGLANVIVFHAVHLLGPTRVTAFQSLVPALAVVLAFLVLGEPIRLAQVVGGVVIVAGVLLTRASSRPGGLRGRPSARGAAILRR